MHRSSSFAHRCQERTHSFFLFANPFSSPSPTCSSPCNIGSLNWSLTVVTPIHYLGVFHSRGILFPVPVDAGGQADTMQFNAIAAKLPTYLKKYTDFFADLALQGACVRRATLCYSILCWTRVKPAVHAESYLLLTPPALPLPFLPFRFLSRASISALPPLCPRVRDRPRRAQGARGAPRLERVPRRDAAAPPRDAAARAAVAVGTLRGRLSQGVRPAEQAR